MKNKVLNKLVRKKKICGTINYAKDQTLTLILKQSIARETSIDKRKKNIFYYKNNILLIS
jgi:hypothetical protein